MLTAQLNQGGFPRSFTFSIPPDNRDMVTLTPPSRELLDEEDAISPLPFRFAINLPVDVDIERSGKWIKVEDGTKVWRITVNAPGALALTLYFDRFQLPTDGKFFVYSPNRTQLIGAFTNLNNNEANTFATALITGDQITLEYNSPEDAVLPQLHLSEVAYAYRGVTDVSGDRTGFGAAGKCEVNVNCSEGASWQRQVRSIARVEVKRGSSSVWCSGSLVNNTRNDGTPYLLTADHCGKLSTPQDLSQWLIYFNYQGAGCPNPTREPVSRTMTGVKLVAHGGDGGNTGSDFFLVRLLSSIPDTFNVYYNGWSRDTIPSPSGVSLHHPQGDIKKISTYTSPLVRSNWNSQPRYTHWRVTWAGTTHGHGTTEGGSSGSPLYNNLGLLVGTLTGGDSSCDSANLNKPDYYGMFYYHWDRNGTDSASVLKYWLDPVNSNVMNCNGWALGVQEPELTSGITVFPNPVTNRVNLRYSSEPAIRKQEIRITDIWGKILWSGNWNPLTEIEITIDLTGLATGMYILMIGDGESRTARKIIKL
ncbi:MAG: T9SS type A sorting domain-containing protein [Bacteroidales bacterium]|nr:T9SS type A sorting domain-containing protein [Bacteroidales bacterium]